MSEKYNKTRGRIPGDTQEIDRRSYLILAGVAGTGLGAGVGAGTLGSEFTTSARAATTTLDNFEDGDISEYSGHTSYFSVQTSTALEGSYTLKGDGLYGELGHNNVTTPRGYEYRYRMQAGSSDAKPCMLVCVQDTNYPQNDCYQVFPDPSSDVIRVQLWQDNSWQKDVISESFSFSAGTEYQIGLKLKSGSLQAVIYDSSGNTLHTTAEVSESTWSGGNLGFYIGGDTPGYFDDVRKIDLDDSGGGGGGDDSDSLLDDFEDGDISEYSGHTSYFNVQSSTTLEGAYTLEGDGLYGSLGHNNVTTPRGYEYRYRMQAGNSGAKPCMLACVQNPDYPQSDCYQVFPDPSSGVIEVHLRENGDWQKDVISESFSFSANTEYQIGLKLKNSSLQVVIYDSSGSTLHTTAEVSESTWSGGNLGFYIGGDTPGYFDDVRQFGLSGLTMLGSFEHDLDGWTTTTNNSLGRVSGDQQPASVTQGDHALEVTVNSDSEPTIQNETRIQNADLENYPCLLADVLPASVENSGSPVTFRFRYHHTDPGGVEESHEMTVDQGYGGRICWDMSGLSAEKLASAERLEIAWYPEEHPPGSGFDYNGVVYVDNVRLTDNQNRVTQARKTRKHRELERAYGPMIDQVIQSESAEVQDGVYEYDNGTEVSYHVEVLDNGNIEETYDGETFTWEVSS